MRITFEGSPAECIEQMKEYIVRLGIEFGRDPVLEPPDSIEKPVRMHEVGDMSHLPPPVAALHQEPVTPIKASNKAVRCKFCDRLLSTAGYARRHESWCDMNPDRMDHPRKGKGKPNAGSPSPIVSDYVSGKYG